MGFSRKRPFSTDKPDCVRNGLAVHNTEYYLALPNTSEYYLILPNSSHSSEHLSFVFLFSFSLFSWSGLFCCVVVTGALTFHLLYLDELRLFGILCFTVVCGHRTFVSLG